MVKIQTCIFTIEDAVTAIDTIEFKVISKTIVGPYTLLSLKTQDEYQQNPGQYCIVHYKVGDHEFTRPYSISSEPRRDGVIELCVMHSGDEQTAQAIQAISEGSSLDISPAGGRFQIPPHDQAACFIAGGSGITPLRSMIRWRLNQSQQGTTLLYGCKKGDEIPYYEDFAKLCEEHKNFKVMFYSEENLSEAVLKGHPLTHFNDFADKDCQYFLCGPPPMVEAAKASFGNYNIPETQVHTDRY